MYANHYTDVCLRPGCGMSVIATGDCPVHHEWIDAAYVDRWTDDDRCTVCHAVHGTICDTCGTVRPCACYLTIMPRD